MSTYSHIVVATDFSPFSTNAAARAKAISEATGCKLSVIHVINYLPPAFVASQLPRELGSGVSLANAARQQVEDWITQCDLDVDQTWIEFGSPSEQILSLPETHGVDLLVVGASGTGLLHTMMGSTAIGVVHNAKCDVLVVSPSK